MTDDYLKWRKYNDMRRVYRNCMSQGWFSTRRKVFSVLVRKPFPCFYITAEYCAKLFRWVESDNGRLKTMRPPTRRMLEHLWGRYNEMLSENPGMPKIHVCEIIVDEPAPELFMTGDSAYNFFLEMQKKERLLNKLNEKPY